MFSINHQNAGSSSGWLHPLVDSKPWPKQFKNPKIYKSGDNFCLLEGFVLRLES